MKCCLVNDGIFILAYETNPYITGKKIIPYITEPSRVLITARMVLVGIKNISYGYLHQVTKGKKKIITQPLRGHLPQVYNNYGTLMTHHNTMAWILIMAPMEIGLYHVIWLSYLSFGGGRCGNPVAGDN